MRASFNSQSVVLAVLLSTVPCVAAGQSTQKVIGDSVAAVVGDLPVSLAQLDELAGHRLISIRNQEYEIRRRMLDELIERTLFEREAAARKVTVEELIHAEVESKVRSVSAEEARSVYDAARDTFQRLGEVEAVKQIEAGMNRQRVAQRRAEFVRALRAKANIRILLEPPRIDVSPTDDPAIGPVDAPVTITEFSDFECPYCGRVVQTIKELAKNYDGKVRIVFRDFPLPIHQQATKAAEAAACASEQGSYLKMRDRLFESQTALTIPDLKRHAAAIGLDSERFSSCLDGGKYAAEWQEDKSDGERYGVTVTPTFFINGRLVAGALPYETFARIIDDELDRRRSATSQLKR